MACLSARALSVQIRMLTATSLCSSVPQLVTFPALSNPSLPGISGTVEVRLEKVRILAEFHYSSLISAGTLKQ